MRAGHGHEARQPGADHVDALDQSLRPQVGPLLVGVLQQSPGERIHQFDGLEVHEATGLGGRLRRDGPQLQHHQVQGPQDRVGPRDVEGQRPAAHEPEGMGAVELGLDLDAAHVLQDDVAPAVGKGLVPDDLAHPHLGPDGWALGIVRVVFRQGRDAHQPDAFADELDETPVAGLEDVQRKQGAGHEHDTFERKDGQLVADPLQHGLLRVAWTPDLIPLPVGYVPHRRTVPLIHVRIGDEEHALALEEWEERVRAGRVPEDALVRFEAVTGVDWVPASELESYRSLRNDAAIAWQANFLHGAPPVLTAALVGVQIRIWMLGWLPGNTETYLLDYTNFAPPTYEDGEVWRLLTSGVLHVEFFHVALNLMWLTYTGWNLERALGRANLALLYTASVVGGALLSMLGSPETRSLGASGGVFGLVAASVVFGLLRPNLLPERGRRLFGIAMLPYLVLMFGSGLWNEGTDNWAHFGGMVVGALLALVLDPVPLQRRAHWNRRWQLGVLSAIAVILTTLGLLGPMLHPLLPADIVRFAGSRAARHDPDAPLQWQAPAGWRSDVGPSGDPGVASPAGQRAWSVVEQTTDTPLTPELLLQRWTERLKRAWPDAELTSPEPVDFVGRAGLFARARIPTPEGPVIVEWRGTTRGIYTLQEVWSVEEAREGRLAPLRDRLRANVSWGDPLELVAARRDIEATPRSRRARAEFADALLRTGDVEGSLSLMRELLEEEPDRETWRALLVLARWHPESVDSEALWSQALRERPDSVVIVEVARGLEAAGRHDEARGLLDVAWGRAPGDRMLRRALRSRGLSTALTTTHLPWHLVHEPDGQPRAAEQVEELQDTSLTLASAAVRAAWLAEQRERAAELAAEGLRRGAESAVYPLFVLKYGHVPADLTEASVELAAELGPHVADHPPDWLPEAVRGILRDDPEAVRRLVDLGSAEAHETAER